MEGDPVDRLVGETIEQGKRRRAQSDQLTYHGAEVPIWEDQISGTVPPGEGWVQYGAANTWRRPHPWRVMLEGAGRRDDAIRAIEAALEWNGIY